MNSFSSYSFGSLVLPNFLLSRFTLFRPLSLEATCLFYHLFYLLSTPFYLFYLFYILFHLFSFFLGRLSNEEDFRHISICFTQIHYEVSKKNKPTEPKFCGSLEAPPRFELGIKVLQTYALPLGYSAILERITRLELATSTLARWRSTR